MRLLPVRPRPADGECFPGYIVRLAHGNGVASVNAFLDSINVPRNAVARIHPDKSILEQVRAVTGHKLSAALFAKGAPEPAYDAHRIYNSLELRRPNVCPLCIVDRGIVHTTGQHLPNTHCRRHARRLLSACPRCGSHFRWAPSLIEGCRDCGLPWSTMTGSQEPAAAYLTAYRRTAANAKAGFLRDLMRAAQRAIRPFDGIMDAGAVPPTDVEDWHSVLATAYGMLTDDETIQQWYAECQAVRKHVSDLGAAAVEQPILSLVSSLERKHWRLVSLAGGASGIQPGAAPKPRTVSFVEHARSARSSRRSHANTVEPLTAQQRFQEGLHGMARLLGISTQSVGVLAERGYLSTVNGTQMRRDVVFDCRDAVSVLPKCENAEGFVNVTSLERSFGLFNASWAEVLAGIFAGDIRARCVGQGRSLAERLQAHPVDVYRFLARHLQTAVYNSEQTVAKTAVCRMLATSPDQLNQLVADGYLKPLPWFQSSMQFPLGDIRDFLDEHLPLGRWCVLHGVSRRGLQAYLAEHGITPVSHGIYPRSPELLRALSTWRQRCPSNGLVEPERIPA